MDTILILPFIPIGVLVVGMMWWFSHAALTKRAFASVKVAPIAEAPVGVLIKISGRIALEGGKSLIAPLSRRECAMWSVLVEEQSVTLVDERDSVEFIVEDASGRARVAMKPPVEISITSDAHVLSGTFDGRESHLVEFLQARGHSTSRFLGPNRQMRWRERILEPGDSVAIIGVGRREMDPDPLATSGYRGKAQRLVIEFNNQGPLLISDDPSTFG